MWWAKLVTDYYRSPEIQQAGEPAEVLYMRALAWWMEFETGGHVPNGIVSTLVARTAKKRVDSLLAVGLWEPCPDHPGCYLDANRDQQRSTKKIANDRAGARERKRREREKKRAENEAETRGAQRETVVRHGVTPPVTNGVSHASSHAVGHGRVTHTDIDIDLDIAPSSPNPSSNGGDARTPTTEEEGEQRNRARTWFDSLPFTVGLEGEAIAIATYLLQGVYTIDILNQLVANAQQPQVDDPGAYLIKALRNARDGGNDRVVVLPPPKVKPFNEIAAVVEGAGRLPAESDDDRRRKAAKLALLDDATSDGKEGH